MARKSKYFSNENVVNKKIWSVALYIRLSQEDSDNGQDKQESNSVTSQKTLLNEFADTHDDLIVYDTYIDDGFTGTDFNNSKVYVPVRESDMIFSVIGENFGFTGGVLLILIYLLLIYLMIRVTFDTKNEFYAYISTGVIMMILFHVFENIGMNIGLLPLTGIPLPFISAGGSSLIGNLIGIGMVMSMRYHHHSYMFSSNREFRQWGHKMAKDYFWVKEQADGTKRIGLNSEGRDELGEVSFIDVPAVGTTLKQADKFIAVEAEKAVTDVDSPVDGKITKINEAIIDDPAGLNSSDVEKNWIVEVK